MVYRELVNLVKKKGEKINWSPRPGTEVYFLNNHYIVLDKTATVNEDLIICVMRKQDTKMIYVSPAVIRGQKHLGRNRYPDELSNPQILKNLFEEWSK